MRKILGLFVIFTLVVQITSTLNLETNAIQFYGNTNSASIESKIDPRLRKLTSDSSQPLSSRQENVRIIAVCSGLINQDQIRGLTGALSIFPFGQGRLVTAVVKAKNLPKLAGLPFVVKILPDMKLDYSLPANDAAQGGKVELDMFKVREITGADRANTVLGVEGKDVKVAIVDTGVDFTTSDLTSALARNETGYPLFFDPDEQGLILTNRTVRAKDGYLQTKNATVKVWTGMAGLMYNITLPEIANYTFQDDLYVGDIVSKSGFYHVGMALEAIDDWNLEKLVLIWAPVIYVDSRKPNVYEDVYFDISTAYHKFLLDYREDYAKKNITLPEPSASWLDWSFADESPCRLGLEAAARDFTRDGVPDFSLGLIGGYFHDFWNVIHPSPLEGSVGVGGVYEGLDLNGNFLCLMYDFMGHGTCTAASVASRGVRKYDVYGNGTLRELKGIAPEAEIIAVKALWLGDIPSGWYWSSGLDYNSTTLEWEFTGKHKADVNSNSWGFVGWPVLGYGSGYDIVSLLEDLLVVSTGTTFVHAIGNAGPGYATGGSPSSSLSISVGASTSMHWRPAESQEKGGRQDDVISWSVRGPNALGAPKPDVVNIGAFAFDSTMVFYGYGNASKAYKIFGGTSESTPLTAGSAALVIESLKKNGFTSVPPDLVKTILMSTAVDIGHDAFSQGSGRIDCFSAVSSVLSDMNSASRMFIMYSTASSINLQKLLEGAVYDMVSPYPAEPLVGEPSWFAGRLHFNETAEATFIVQNPTNTSIDISVEPYTFELIGNRTYRGYAESEDTWVNLTDFAPIPSETALISIALTYPFKYFDKDKDYKFDNVRILYVYDWKDENKDGRPEPSECALINYGYTRGTTQVVRISNPKAKFLGTPQLRINQRFGNQSLPFQIHVDFYRKTRWRWVEVTTGQKFTVPNNSTERFTLKLTMASSEPGVYEGAIGLAGSNGQSATIPVSAVEISTLTHDNRSATFGGPPKKELYDNYGLIGGFNWEGTYEDGDSRVYTVEIDDPHTYLLKVEVEWIDNDTCVDVFVLAPDGVLIATTDTYYYKWNGTFEWHATSGRTKQTLYASVAGHWTGRYTIIVHNILFGGSTFPESIKLSLSIRSNEPASLKPFVRVDSPQNGSILKDTVMFECLIATHPELPLTSISLTIDEQTTINLANLTEYQWMKEALIYNVKAPIDTRKLTNGRHTLVLVTSDTTDQRTSTKLLVTVDNETLVEKIGRTISEHYDFIIGLVVGGLIVFLVLRQRKRLRPADTYPHRVEYIKEPRFCHYCGAQVDSNALFCTSCGKQLIRNR